MRFRFLLASIFGFIPILCFAQLYSSSNFVLENPTLTLSGGRSTSPSFEFYSALGETAIGESASGSFLYRSGFLYFPVVTTPILSATAADGQVVLSWTAASPELGWTVSGYEVGQSTVSGGPYIFTSVGNVLGVVRSGLTNGTTYYFVVRTLDAFGNVIATSSQVTATPVGSTTSGGGGGGGGYGPGSASITFAGRAYPESTVTLLKDSQIAVATIAGPDARFEISLSGLSGGSYMFSLYSTDSNGNRSALITIPVTLAPGSSTYISGIFIAPTIAVDKPFVERGENIAIFGQTAPVGNVIISVHSNEEILVNTPSDENGVYLYNFDTSPLELGGHSAKSRVTLAGEASSFGNPVPFGVGVTSTIPVDPSCRRADVNCDGRVNLVDFSIAAYWYRRALSSEFLEIEKARLSNDGKIDLVDFSIMAYYWSG